MFEIHISVLIMLIYSVKDKAERGLIFPKYGFLIYVGIPT